MFARHRAKEGVERFGGEGWDRDGVVKGRWWWWGATDGTPRCEGRRLPWVGGGGRRVEWGPDKWEWEEAGFFPRSGSGDDEERGTGCVYACLVVASVCVCVMERRHSDFLLSEVRSPLAPELYSFSESLCVGGTHREKE